MRMIGRLEQYQNNEKEEFRIWYCCGECEPIHLLFTAQCGLDGHCYVVYMKDDIQQVYAALLCADRLLEIEDPDRWADITLMLDKLETARMEPEAHSTSEQSRKEALERQWNKAVSRALTQRRRKE